MLQEKLKAIKDYLLQYNTYFANAYDDVVLDADIGIVHDGQPVFPNDGLGNYFYLRLPDNMLFDYTNIYSIAEGVNGVGLRVPVVLVACVQNANADGLLSNLVNTLRSYQPDFIKFTQAVYQSRVVVMQELGKLKKNIANATLQRLRSSDTIVSIAFSVNIPFTFSELNCIKDPTTC